MHTLLAIESSSQYCSLALATPHGVFEHHIGQAQQHSAQLLPAVAALLAQAKVSQPDLIAVAIGPGAFTSVRVAVGTVQGLALGWGCEVLAVGSLAALAQYARRSQGLSAGARVVAMLDARMGEAYCASYEVADAALHCTVAPHLIAYEAQSTSDAPADYVVGNAAAMMPHWGTWGRASIEALPLALDVLTLAQQGLADGSLRAMDPALLQPLYVRDQVALTELQRSATLAAF